MVGVGMLEDIRKIVEGARSKIKMSDKKLFLYTLMHLDGFYCFDYSQRDSLPFIC
ncbi:MAG: hypothetical protein LBI98_02460 [Endomicrobium sp.]|jgi:hypothetical protein|nr:hypothetical protein [Endomicrobium sp.]